MKFECKWTYNLRQGDLAKGRKKKRHRQKGRRMKVGASERDTQPMALQQLQ